MTFGSAGSFPRDAVSLPCGPAGVGVTGWRRASMDQAPRGCKSPEGRTRHSTRSTASDNLPVVAEADLRGLLERHVELFNEAVRTGDYGPFLETFSERAVMRFDNVPMGPFNGLPEIAEAYATEPPTDTMALTAMEEIGGDGVRALFEWDAGGTGQLFLRWDDEKVVELAITFTS
jgi:steroid Delta-isomerase